MKDEIIKLLSKGILHDFIYENKKYNLIVKEPENSAPHELGNFKILDLPRDSVAFSLDFRLAKGQIKRDVNNSNIQNFSWLIKGDHENANKKCDIIIIVPKPEIGKHLVIIGELKSGLGRKVKRNAENQLKNSRMVLDYIFELLKEYEFDSKPKLVFRKVVFSNDRRANTLNSKPQGNNADTIKYVEVKNGTSVYLDKIVRIIQ